MHKSCNLGQFADSSAEWGSSPPGCYLGRGSLYTVSFRNFLRLASKFVLWEPCEFSLLLNLTERALLWRGMFLFRLNSSSTGNAAALGAEDYWEVFQPGVRLRDLRLPAPSPLLSPVSCCYDSKKTLARCPHSPGARTHQVPALHSPDARTYMLYFPACRTGGNQFFFLSNLHDLWYFITEARRNQQTHQVTTPWPACDIN